VGAGDAGRKAHDMMELDRPALDWVSMARGMGVERGAPRRWRNSAGSSKPGYARRDRT
jgi:hypothetical protein